MVLLLAIVSTCRQQPAAVSTDTAATNNSSDSDATTTSAAATNPPRAAANVTNAAETVSNEAPIATLTAADAAAEITVRSQPSQESEPLGYGRVGEPVVLGRTATDAAGYTWHYVTFQTDATVGWVRADLLDIPTLQPTAQAPSNPAAVSQTPSDTLKQSLDETCGGQRAIESYFVTPTNTIYICKVRGQRTYLSQETGTEQVITAQDVEALGGGYIISNGNFEYRLDSSSLVVVRLADSGQPEEVLRETIVYTERYK